MSTMDTFNLITTYSLRGSSGAGEVEALQEFLLPTLRNQQNGRSQIMRHTQWRLTSAGIIFHDPAPQSDRLNWKGVIFDAFRIAMDYCGKIAFLTQRAYRGFMAARQATQRQAEQPRGPLAASDKAVQQLRAVVITPEDLVDPSNRECCICLEEHHLKERVTRLLCAHVFHKQCILDWLIKSNTCPVCRLELPTDNPTLERTREQRMRNRKPRFALYELQRMSIHELRELGEYLQVTMVCIVDKQELIQKMVSSGRIEIIAAPDPVEYPLSLLRAMSVSELRRAMVHAGVFFDPVDVVEKDDMIHIFVNSGRLVISAEASVVVRTIYDACQRALRRILSRQVKPPTIANASLAFPDKLTSNPL